MTCEACDRPVLAKGLCNLHYNRMNRTGRLDVTQPQIHGLDVLDRIAAYVSFDEDGCWRWTRSTSTKGYGMVAIDGRQKCAHRVLYELVVEPVDEGLQLDHLCRNRACCNPDHLEPVEPRENYLRGEGAAARNARKTHCVHGHELTPENTYQWAEGRRGSVCVLASQRQRRSQEA